MFSLLSHGKHRNNMLDASIPIKVNHFPSIPLLFQPPTRYSVDSHLDLRYDQSYQQQYQKNNKKQLMTSLCTPFLSNFSSSNVFLLLATSLAGLLTFLNHPKKSSIPEPSKMQPSFTAKQRSFSRVKSCCRYDGQGETVASTTVGSSLSQIMSNDSSDFKNEREEAGLVHSLELNEECDESYDVQTVMSCMMSFRDDPNSTENSFGSEDQLSDIEDL